MGPGPAISQMLLKLAVFCKKVFNWKIEKTPGPVDYWLIETVPTDCSETPSEPRVNGGMMKREYRTTPNQLYTGRVG